MKTNKYIKPFYFSPEELEKTIKKNEIVFGKGKAVSIRNGNLAERIVSKKISNEKISLIDKIVNLVLHIFSSDYREAKKFIAHQLINFKQMGNLKQIALPIIRNEKILEEYKGPSLLTQLPQELHAEIFSYLDKKDLQTVRQTTKIFEKIHHNPLLLSSIIENHTNQFTLDELISLSKFCGMKVKKLNLNNAGYFLKKHRAAVHDDKGLEQLLNAYPNLEELHLEEHHLSKICITEKDLENIAKLKNLKKLKLSGCVNDACVKKLVFLQKLKSLDLSKCHITDKALENIASLKELQELNLSGCEKITDKTLENIASLIELQELNLSGCGKITDKGLSKLANLNKLERLYLDYCKYITDLTPLLNLEKLTFLSIKDLPLITDKTFFIDNLKQLKYFVLSNCKKLTDISFVKIADKKSLKYLDLSYCNVTDKGIQAISELELNKLYIDECDRITDTSLKNISKIKNLTTLSLSRNPFTSNGFKHFSNMEPLEELHLCDYQNLPDQSLKHFRNLKSLKLIDASGSSISDADLEIISTFPSLESLILDKCRNISDQGVKHLSLLQTLKFLSLANTRITDNGLDQLSNLEDLTIDIRNCIDVSYIDIRYYGISKLAKLREMRERIEG